MDALPPAESGALADLGGEVRAQLGELESAYWLVEDSAEAMNVRLAMFDTAETSLDLQYFIWEDDASGQLLWRRLLQAADRGVRVRLLLDDVTTSGRDQLYLTLDAHPLIEVRLFNPWRHRSHLGRVAEFIARFRALNHRLHNKTVIADGQLALLGGRNIGDRYFGLYDVFVQNDLDILFVGPMTDRVISDFDLYWNASESYPVEGYLKSKKGGLSLGSLAAQLDDEIAGSADLLRQFPLQPTTWPTLLDQLAGSFAAGRGEYLFDLPNIRDMPPTQLYCQLKEFLERARDEVVISSAYFVPDEKFVEQLTALVDRGVRVYVLTNSLQTNNHTLAHVAYKRWRRRLLESGILLYELRPDAPILADYAVAPATPGFLGLHSKAAIVDREWTFVGTPNFDPRALLLNTENGVAVESAALADELGELMRTAMSAENSWHVSLDERGKVVWNGSDTIYTRQPANGLAQRIVEFFVNLLPLKKQA